jgi:hypothetical protein
MPLCNTSSGSCTAKKVKLLQVQELYPSRGATTLTWWEGLRASVILKAMPTGASAPDRGTYVGKAEGERPDKKQLPACPDAKVATPPPESDAEG